MNFIFILYFLFIGFLPNFLLHTDNYIPADPLVTPTHIVPEWYFLIFYAMLRSIPSKAGGIIVLLFSILLLFALPYMKNSLKYTQEDFFSWGKRKFIFFKSLNKRVKKAIFMEFDKFFFWVFFITCCLLGYIGSQPIEYPYLTFGRELTALYFVYFFSVFFLNKNFLLFIKLYKDSKF